MSDLELRRLADELRSMPKECEWVEFKVNNIDPDEIGRNLSALSNGAACHDQRFGFMLFGIEDGTHELVGTSFYPKLEKKGNEELEHWLGKLLEPRADFVIYEWDNDGKHFALFRIEAARDRPVMFRNTAFVRVGSYSKPLREFPEKERKIWLRKDADAFETGFAKEKIDGGEVLSLLDYPGYFEMMGIPLPEHRSGILQRLVDDKLVVTNGSRFDVSSLGAILFARDIEAFEEISRKSMRVVVYDGNNRTKTKKEQLGRKGYALGFKGLIQYLDDQIPKREILIGGFQRSVSDFPLVAVRELVANAMIHQDFTIRGAGPMVEVFDNRIEITNPGRAIIEALRFLDHSPQSRNERLARYMRRLHICEERGSGIDKVIFECEFYQLPAPEFLVEDSYTRVILHGPRLFRDMDKQDKERACYLHACLKYVSGEYLTNQSLRSRFGIEDHNYSIASRIISDTIQSGLIKEHDKQSTSRRFAKYVPFWA